MSNSYDPMDYTPPSPSIHGISQARIQEWVAISFSRGSSRLRDQTQVSCIAGSRFTLWATREAPLLLKAKVKSKKNQQTPKQSEKKKKKKLN